MRPKLIPALFLFLGSYWPLSLILAIEDIKASSWTLPLCDPREWAHGCHVPTFANPERSLGFLAACTVSLVFFLLSLLVVEKRHELTVRDFKAIPNDLINYVFPYVVAFMSLDLGDTGKWYGFLLFLGWMFIITYRSQQILMNPLLLIIGWQLYEINATIEEKQRTVRAFARERLERGATYGYCRVQELRVLIKGEPSDEKGG